LPDSARGGSFGVESCIDQDEALACIKPHLSDKTLVMVKGSHSTNLNMLVDKLMTVQDN
jgi:UDP-N-acetylmuramyl pentapeptide synthase